MGYHEKHIFVIREAIRQWFSLETSSLVKIITEPPHSWQKLVNQVNPHIILYVRDVNILQMG